MVPNWCERGMQEYDDGSTTLQPASILNPTSLVLLVMRPDRINL